MALLERCQSPRTYRLVDHGIPAKQHPVHHSLKGRQLSNSDEAQEKKAGRYPRFCSSHSREHRPAEESKIPVSRVRPPAQVPVPPPYAHDTEGVEFLAFSGATKEFTHLRKRGRQPPATRAAGRRILAKALRKGEANRCVPTEELGKNFEQQQLEMQRQSTDYGRLPVSGLLGGRNRDLMETRVRPMTSPRVRCTTQRSPAHGRVSDPACSTRPTSASEATKAYGEFLKPRDIFLRFVHTQPSFPAPPHHQGMTKPRPPESSRCRATSRQQASKMRHSKGRSITGERAEAAAIDAIDIHLMIARLNQPAVGTIEGKHEGQQQIGQVGRSTDGAAPLKADQEPLLEGMEPLGGDIVGTKTMPALALAGSKPPSYSLDDDSSMLVRRLARMLKPPSPPKH